MAESPNPWGAVWAKVGGMNTAISVANEFIRCGVKRGRPLTQLQIQKLVYFAHARMLCIHGRPLIEDIFERRQHGPVVPALYERIKVHGSEPITVQIEDDASDKRGLPLIETDVVGWAYSTYGALDGFELAQITHAKGSPWFQARPGEVIPNDTIRGYHAPKFQKQQRRRLQGLLGDPEIRRGIEAGLEEIRSGQVTEVDIPRPAGAASA